MLKLISFLIVLLILLSCHTNTPVVPIFIDTTRHSLPIDTMPLHPVDTTYVAQ